MRREDNADREIDIVQVILDLVSTATSDLTPEKSRDIEQIVRTRYGGLRLRIVKRKKHPTPEQREQITRDSLSPTLASVPTDQIAESNGIHRATLYRYLKRRTS